MQAPADQMRAVMDRPCIRMPHQREVKTMHTMLDTGTGLAPMVSWSTTGSYTATTLGVSNLAFAPFAPMLWLSIVFSVIYAVTGIGTAKAKED